MHKGWHSRGYLPHFDEPYLIQSITFRLHDSLPKHVLEELRTDPKWRDDVKRRQKLEEFLNVGYGKCYLQQPDVAREVEDVLFFSDGTRYHLLVWCIMPNHVHVLIFMLEGYPLDLIIKDWKSISARNANDVLGRKGTFWYPDYFDRYMRNARHFERVVNYIHFNPVAAGLVDEPEQWRFSSARLWQDRQGDLPDMF